MKTRIESHAGYLRETGRAGRDGLTITEVCCALAALALLLTVTLPALAMSKGRSQRIVCVNNLSRIGQATAMWANEHEGRRPSQTPYWQGGILTSGIAGSPPPGTPSFSWGQFNNQLWFHYFWLSNELVTPKVLLCPSDTGSYKRPAGDWSLSSTTGLLHPNFRNNGVSYILGLHARSETARGLVSADRNFPRNVSSANCYYGYVGLGGLLYDANLKWEVYGSLSLHAPEGNLLFSDGTVEQADSDRIRAVAQEAVARSEVLHLMVP